MTRYAFAIALILAVAGSAAAQSGAEKRYVLTGTLTDSISGAPVAAAAVRFERLQRAVLTDSTGTFTMPDMAAGTHEVEVSRIGYQPRATTVVVSGDRSMTMNLVPLPISLEAITAVSNRLERRRQRVPMFVRAFDAKVLSVAMTDLRTFLNRQVGPLVMCPSNLRGRSLTEPYCVISRGDYRELTVYINDMRFTGAQLDLYFSNEFELVEFYTSAAMLRLYTTEFIERVASGKQHIAPILD